MKLIDANELMNVLKENHDYLMQDPEVKASVKWREAVVFHSVSQTVRQAPTVDAVELPCKIGDKVYRIDKGNYHTNWKPFVEELTVTEISWKKEKYGDKDLGFAIIASGIRYKFTSIGKSVFLTRKEAEAKMDGDTE